MATNIDTLIRFEDGELDFDETVEFIQSLVDSGVVWSLQGSYGRIAADLINEGLVTLPED